MIFDYNKTVAGLGKKGARRYPFLLFREEDLSEICFSCLPQGKFNKNPFSPQQNEGRPVFLSVRVKNRQLEQVILRDPERSRGTIRLKLADSRRKKKEEKTQKF